jgi:hypothetical protein
MRALLVVMLVAAAGLVYVERPGDAGPSRAAVYRHYFAIGKHACELPKPAPTDGIVWSGLTTPAIKIPRSVPDEQRRALIAGCNAAR